MQKFGAVLFCLLILGLGAYMAIDPSAFNFDQMRTSGRNGLFKSAFKFIGESIGARPFGGILAGVGGLGLLVMARPKKTDH